MGSTLTGQTKAATYDALLKITDNGPVGGTEKVVTDGLGNDSALKVGTAGVSSTGTLGANGDLTVSGITSRQIIGAFTGGSSALDFDLTDSGGGAPTIRFMRSATVGTSLQIFSPGTVTKVAQVDSAGLTVPVGGINSTAIGAVTPSTGAFTTLSATGATSVPLDYVHGGNVKTSSNTVYTANTTLADLSGLSVTLIAGSTYYFDADLFLTWSSTGGFKFALGGTATATTLFASVGTDYGTSGGRTMSIVTALGAAVSPTAPSGGGNGLCHIAGTIIVNTGGTLTIQAAQLAATSSSTVYALSTFRVRKLA